MNSWKITSQILILQLVTILTVLTILLTLLILLFVSINEQVTSDSNKIMINKLLARYSYGILNDHSRLIQQKFQQITQSLEVVNKLSAFIINNDYQNTQNVDACLLDELDESNMLYFNQFCYGIFDSSNHQPFDLELKISNILTYTMPMQKEYENLYFLTDNAQQYFSCFPGIYLGGYVPNERPWYLNQKNTTQNCTYSEPYPDYQGGILITETMNLFGQKDEILGVIGQDITSRLFELFNYQQNLQFYLIDLQGRILLFPGMNTKVLLYYFDQEITGFNQTDFESLLKFAQTKEIDNTAYTKICPPIETLCLLNKVTNEYIYIYVDIHPITQYLFIVEVPSSYFQVYFKQLDDFLNTEILTYAYFSMYLFIGIIMFCLVAFYVTTKMIQKPIECILNRTNSILKSNEDINKQELQELDETNAIGQLGFAFERLIQLFNQQEMNCKPSTETYQYPTRNLSLSFYLNPRHLRFLKDNQHIPMEVKLKLIRNVSQQLYFKNKMNFLLK